MQKVWKRKIKKEDLPGPKLRLAIWKHFDEWMRRSHGGMNYHLTQLLTGHGCFISYLQCIRKVESAMCKYCGRFVDNAEHTWMICEERNSERDNMKVALNVPIDMDKIVVAICTKKDTWQVVNTFAQCIMGKKKEDEQMEKQRKKQEARLGRARGPGEVGSQSQSIDWEMEVGFDLEEEMDEDWVQGQDPGS